MADDGKRYVVVEVRTGDRFGAVNGVPYWEAFRRANAMALNWGGKKKFEVREVNR